MADLAQEDADRQGVDRSGTVRSHIGWLRLRMDGGEAKLTQRNLRFDRRMDSFG